jgi:DNA (cytosine-5)-methyltransferase 1
MDFRVVDIFCGIGGLSYGFKAEGFNVVAGYDLDESCRYAFEENIGGKFVASDITDVAAAEIAALLKSKKRKKAHTVLIGCAPCTPFSIYVGRYKRNAKNDHRWQLLEEFSRLAIAVKPDVISMENVPRLARHSVFHEFVKALTKAGYTVNYKTVRAHHFGVPQLRTRLVLIASLHGLVEMPSPTHEDKPVTVRAAIGRLPRISAGIPDKRDRLHVSRNLSEKNLLRLRSTREGGSWKDWDRSLLLRCHKRSEGKSFRSVYGRMRWNFPAPVITTQCLGIGNGRFGHPQQNRAISIREAALLQSFPRSYKFLPTHARVNGLMLARQIGNAVPVKLGKAIARSIKKHLASVPC